MLVLVDKVVFLPWQLTGFLKYQKRWSCRIGIVTNISVTFILNIMRFQRSILIIGAMVILFVCVCGCTTTPNTSPVGVTTTAPAVPPVPSYTQVTSAYQAAKNSGLETTIDTHFNDFNCLDIQKALGVDYLYPDQKYTIWATSPAGGTINVNILVLKVDDYEKIQTVKPAWDTVKKTWVYDGISPLIQLNDVSVPQEKTLTIKNQGKYFLCADDRKESGINDAIFRVPVKITRL
jgi:hypothetical protein